jgi:glycosyltransferase involved in cell wall biosynthesis
LYGSVHGIGFTLAFSLRSTPPIEILVTPQRISVVIPCYNGARYLEQALASVLEQTRPVDEIIVVDDGSTDDSADIARRAGVRCLSIEENVGPGASRNRGIAACSGEIIAFLDADDYWMPAHIGDMTALLERFPQSSVAFSRILRFGDDDRVSPEQLPEGPPINMFWRLIEENIVAQSSAVVRREALLRVGCYNISFRYSEDYDLWLRLARRFLFVCTNGVTAGYRVHPSQASRNVSDMLHGRWQVKHQFWLDARAKDSPEFVKQLEAQMLIAWEDGLRSAWWDRNDVQLRAALEVHDLVPGSAKTYRRWMRRLRYAWKPWLGLADVWEQLSPPVRRVLRPALDYRFGSTGARAPLPEYLPPPYDEVN